MERTNKTIRPCPSSERHQERWGLDFELLVLYTCPSYLMLVTYVNVVGVCIVRLLLMSIACLHARCIGILSN